MLTDTSYFRNPHYHQASDVPANVDFEPSRPPYSGPLATFPASPIQFNPETGEASASFPMALAPQMASLLNETIGATRGKPSLFSAGEPLGTVSFTARTR